MRYYATDDRLWIAREENALYYHWDWVKQEWIYDAESVMLTCRTDADEITEEEAIYAIKHRKVPIVSYYGA